MNIIEHAFVALPIGKKLKVELNITSVRFHYIDWHTIFNSIKKISQDFSNLLGLRILCGGIFVDKMLY